MTAVSMRSRKPVVVHMILEAVRDFYLARWGAPARTEKFDDGEFSLAVYRWSADTSLDVNLNATLGASARPMVGQDPRHRAEFFIGFEPDLEAVASPLAALALYSAKVAVDHGHTVPVDGGVWDGTEMSRFLVMKPSDELIEPLLLADGTHIEFLQVVPIFESEFAYQRDHGADALNMLGARSRLRWTGWDVSSPSTVAE